MMFLTGIVRSFYPLSKQTPLRLPQGGEAQTSSNETLTWKPNTPSGRKEVKPMPSPFGEGQTDMPINHHHLGEVQHQTPLPSPPRGRSPSCPRTKSFPWKTVTAINRPAPFPVVLSGATALRERRRRREGREARRRRRGERFNNPPPFGLTRKIYCKNVKKLIY